MSFILDALRKSESERQRLETATLAELPIGRRRASHPWWVAAVAGLLLLNLIVLGVLLTRNRNVLPPPTSSVSTSSNRAVSLPTSSAQPSSTQSLAMPAASVSASAIPLADAPDVTSPTPRSSDQSLQEAASPQSDVEYETVPRSEMDVANAAASVPDGPRLVRPVDGSHVSDAAAEKAMASVEAGDAASTDLHLDLHVYSRNPRERFVLINMHRYTEGERIPNGATVEQITPDGVVLYQNGTRYKLNRN